MLRAEIVRVLLKKHGTELGTADPCRIFQHFLKYRLKFARRTRDDLKNFRRRGLLLQRFSQIAVRCRSSLSKRVFSIAITA